MIHIHATKQPTDDELLAVTYTTGSNIPPVIRLVAQPLEAAETKMWETFGAEKQHHTTVGYTPRRATGFPAWAILTDPNNAHHALNLVADVEWARRQAKTAMGTVKKRIDQLTGDLQKSAPHFLPTFLEEIARIFADAGNLPYAKQFFSKARDIERTHALTIDPERHTQAVTEFAALGVVGAKAFSQEARDAANRLQPQEAYDYFFTLLIEQAKTGAGIPTTALKDLEFLTKKTGRNAREMEEEFFAAYITTKSFYKAPRNLLEKILSCLPYIARTQPELAEILYTTIPEEWDVDTYVTALEQADLWEPLCADAEKFTTWLARIIHHGNSWSCFFEPTNRALLTAIMVNRDAVATMPVEIKTFACHLDYLDALTATGNQWVEHPLGIIRLDRSCLRSWFAHHHRDLSALMGREDTRAELIKSLTPEDLNTHLDTLLGHESTRKLVELKLESLCTDRENATGSKRSWDSLSKELKQLTNPRLGELYPQQMSAIFRIDPVEELAERIRRGTVVEYAWPAFEEITATRNMQDTTVRGKYPWVSIHDDHELIILDGTDVRTYPLPERGVREVFPTPTDVFLTYYDSASNNIKWMWLEKGVTGEFNAHTYYGSCSDTNEYTTVIDDTLYIGPTAINHEKLDDIPAGIQLGFGPIYAVSDSEDTNVTMLPPDEASTLPISTFQERFAAGQLPGLDIPRAAHLAREHGATIIPAFSFATRVTETITHSAFGVEDDRVFGIFLKSDSHKWCVSSLGTFSMDDDYAVFPIRRPAGGVWSVYQWSMLLQPKHCLEDPESHGEVAGALTAEGTEHALNFLPVVGFHHVQVRNEMASAKMRACTYEQAAEFLANPLSILGFVEHDETLAAAIAGMIVEISEIPHVTIELPRLDVVPKPLTYLYKTLGVHIPLPPALDPDNPSQYFAEEMVYLAQVLADPRENGEVCLSHAIDMILETIGKEKIWLAQLATPGLPIEKVRSYHAFLSWCADYHVLGTWHRVSVPRMFYTNEWTNKVLSVGTYSGNALLWNPALSTRPELPEHQVHLNDELFVPADEFKAMLDEILNWHEKRHVAGTTNTPAW